MRYDGSVTLVHRVLHPNPIISLEDHVTRGGGKGLTAAREMEPTAIIERVLASGLRGRGGAGFPVGRKWQTVASNWSAEFPPASLALCDDRRPLRLESCAAHALLFGADAHVT